MLLCRDYWPDKPKTIFSLTITPESRDLLALAPKRDTLLWFASVLVGAEPGCIKAGQFSSTLTREEVVMGGSASDIDH